MIIMSSILNIVGSETNPMLVGQQVPQQDFIKLPATCSNASKRAIPHAPPTNVGSAAPVLIIHTFDK